MSTPEQPNPDDFLTPDERTTLRRLLSAPEEYPTEFGAWIVDFLALNGKLQPFQVEGLSLTAPRTDVVLTQETRAWENAYADLATPGPQLTELGKGTYLVIFAAEVQNTESGVESHLSISINGATALDADGVTLYTSSTSLNAPITRFIVLDLPLPKNTIKCQYKRIGSGTSVAYFKSRSLIAIRMGS